MAFIWHSRDGLGGKSGSGWVCWVGSAALQFCPQRDVSAPLRPPAADLSLDFNNNLSCPEGCGRGALRMCVLAGPSPHQYTGLFHHAASSYMGPVPQSLPTLNPRGNHFPASPGFRTSYTRALVVQKPCLCSHIQHDACEVIQVCHRARSICSSSLLSGCLWWGLARGVRFSSC